MNVLQRAFAGATGFAAGISLGLMVTGRDLASLGAAIVLGIALLGLVRLVVPVELRATAMQVAGLAYAVRVAAAAIFHAFAVDTGREWLYIVGDDRDYAMLSWNLVLYMRGQGGEPWTPPGFNGLTHLFGTFVYLEAAVFSLFGPNLQLVQTINGALGAVMVIFIFDLARSIGGARAAIVAGAIVAVHPSLVVWSALNLKEGLASALVALVVHQLVSFVARPGWQPLVTAYAALVPLESLRRYVFVGLDILGIIAVLAAIGLRPWMRARVAVAAIGVAGAFLAMNQLTLSQLGLMNILPTLEHSRTVMNDAARTGFVDRPVVARQGDTFVIVVGTPHPAATPTASPRVTPIRTATPRSTLAPFAGVTTDPTPPPAASPAPTPRVVSAGTKLVVLPPTAPPHRDTTDVVYVRPGDIIVFGPPGSIASPEARPLLLPEGESDVRLRQPSSELALTKTLSYLPRGAAYALGAPFPWALERPIDALTIPEMLYWYVAVAAAVTTVWRERSRWRELLIPVLFVGGTLMILALAEGNYGTLFRHRGMVIPVTSALAAPTLAGLVWRRRSSGSASAPARGHLVGQL